MRKHTCPRPRSRCFLQGSGWPQDVVCVNGVAIDIDVFTEGFERVRHPLAPCHPGFCATCSGTGEFDDGDCESCAGTGSKLGANDSVERLEAEAALAKTEGA